MKVEKRRNEQGRKENEDRRKKKKEEGRKLTRKTLKPGREAVTIITTTFRVIAFYFPFVHIALFVLLGLFWTFCSAFFCPTVLSAYLLFSFPPPSFPDSLTGPNGFFLHPALGRLTLAPLAMHAREIDRLLLRSCDPRPVN